MFKRFLVVLVCILLIPTIAASATQEGTRNFGEFWIGGHGGGLFAADSDAKATAGGIVGYNFCMPNRPAWQRYFGVAVDFSWNQFSHTFGDLGKVKGDQFALAFLGRVQLPLMGDERFTRGRVVPFLMAGPAVVWTNNYGGERSDVGVVAELGMEIFMIPRLSIGPSFRYRHVWITEGQNQYMVLGRLAYHF